MKKLMILGAGIYQVPLIQRAKEMGLYTIVVSCAGAYPGFALADQVLEIDTTDCEGVLEAARREQISGICTSGTDVAVKTIGYVCDHMGLAGISEEAARIVTDKTRMKDAFVKGGVSTAPFCSVHTLAEARQAAETFGLPVMMKAADTSGSRGVSKVESLEGLEEAYTASVQVSRQEHYVVEKYVEGTEIGVDAFVSNGELVMLQPHGKFVKHCASTTVPAGHWFPYDCSEKLAQELENQIRLVIKATGMDNCAVNADVFVLPDDTVSIIEAGGRAGATCIPELISIYCGFDYYEQMIANAMGESVDFTPKRAKPCMAKLLCAEKTGQIKSVDLAGIQALNTLDTQVSLDYGVGDKVSVMHNGTDRIGQVIMQTGDEEKIGAVIEKIRRYIVIE